MRFPLIAGIALLLINSGVDLWIYRILRSHCRSRLPARVHAVVSALLAALLVTAICLPKRNGSDPLLYSVMWMLYTYLSFYVPKYIYLALHLVAQAPRLAHRRPLGWLSACGAALGAAAWVVMWWGALINRYNVQVCSAEVEVERLPAAFEGFTIAQISDLHVGTYERDTAFVSKLVDRVNELRPDMIVFTGDMVNRRSEEMEPYVAPLSRLRAPCGVYSVMGNHDYGDYSDWPSPRAKEQDVEHLKQMQAQAGLRMLNNTHEWIHLGADSIALIGVENIGDPPFKRYGDLSVAYPDLADESTKILLTHNPAHWESEIADKGTNVALTLSGHTHAMQMELLGLSPAALRYDKWGGLYSDSRGQHLYVNIGAGTVGMPYRIGATPEITVLTLTAK